MRSCRFSIAELGASLPLVVTINRILLVLMVIEILHTVRVSFNQGALVCEPFLVVGLIATICRVLVITLESSQVQEPGRWTPELQGPFNSSMIELCVLGDCFSQWFGQSISCAAAICLQSQLLDLARQALVILRPACGTTRHPGVRHG